MNVLSEEKVTEIKIAFHEGLSLRDAADRCGVNRDTVANYYKQWKAEESQPSKHAARMARLMLMIEDPKVIREIDIMLMELRNEYENLVALKARKLREQEIAVLKDQT